MANDPPRPDAAPVLCVSVMIVREGRVLLVRRGRAPFAGLWALPGGRVEPGERLAEAARREVREETGLTAEDLRRIDVVEILPEADGAAGGAHGHFVLVVFQGTCPTGEPQAGDDASDALWAGADETGDMNLTDETRAMIETHGRRR